MGNTESATTSVPTPSQQSRRWSFPRSAAPTRPDASRLIVATATSVIALLLVAGAGQLLHQTTLIPPLAASMALVAGAPTLPLAQPRNVIGGQVISALTGFIVLLAAPPGVWTAAIAGGLALGAMLLLRVSHSPAAATAVIVALQAPPVSQFLALLAFACLILVVVGLISAKLARAQYPQYWW